MDWIHDMTMKGVQRFSFVEGMYPDILSPV